MSSLLPPPVPPALPKYYVYAVVDPSTTPPTILKVEHTRKECRTFIEWREDADRLRIRRGQLKLYTS
jgi:hypothetical protein